MDNPADTRGVNGPATREFQAAGPGGSLARPMRRSGAIADEGP